MSEQLRHIAIIALAVGLALTAAIMHVCEHELYALALAIVTGEFGLARSGTSALRVDHPVTINQQDQRGQS